MATIPAGTRFIGISTTADLTERKSTSQNEVTEAFTIEDLMASTNVFDVSDTTSALSLSTLNSNYPVANYPIGSRVICADISGGGLIYLRTKEAVWVSYSVTTVS